MSHNTTNAICFVAWYAFIAFLAVAVSPWFVALVAFSPEFRTDKELEKQRQHD